MTKPAGRIGREGGREEKVADERERARWGEHREREREAKREGELEKERETEDGVAERAREGRRQKTRLLRLTPSCYHAKQKQWAFI